MAKYGRGKRSGTNSGRYGRSSNSQRFLDSIKDRQLKSKNPKKYKRRKKIAKFSADGKITSDEAKKLVKKGISMDKVLNQNINEYRNAQKYTDKANMRRRGRDQTMGKSLDMPNFQPLKIKNKARERFSSNMLDLDKRPEPQKTESKPQEEEVSVAPSDKLPEPELTEEKVKELTPTTPYGVENLASIRNPRGRIRGGIGQFGNKGASVPGRQFKYKLLNI